MAQKTCPNGHTYNKTSACPTCPVCEVNLKPEKGFLSLFAAPARRALERAGILSVRQLSTYSQQEIMNLHGMGPASLPKLRQALEGEGLSFKEA